ncbi:MAG: guanylate kinase [Flavobacteriales bacterium]
MSGKAIIFSAPSGAGKTTLVRHLMLSDELKLSFSVSATTRAKRATETEGVDYYFITPEDFIERSRRGDFIEWEEVYTGQYYGTLRSEVERLWSEGKHVIFDLDVVGGLNLKKIFGERALAVFVKPPSIESLKNRLHARNTETPEKLAQRIAKAEHELTFEQRFDVTIVNDDLERAKEDAHAVVLKFIQQ